MFSTAIAFGLVSLMLCVGMLLKGKSTLFQNTLIPVSVIGGVFGFIIVNFILEFIPCLNISNLNFNDIVDVFFTFSFISIGLSYDKNASSSDVNETETTRKKGKSSGIIGMSLIWCVLYALTPALGAGVIALTGKAFQMAPIYGLLIPFAFCQGPGQAITYGRLFENVYGYQGAEAVALTFSVIGFFVAFIVGIPIAKRGIEKGITRNKDKIDNISKRGYYREHEQNEVIGKVTTCSASIDTIALHLAVMGSCYLLGNILSIVIAFIPGIGPTFSSMNFFWGLIVAFFVKRILLKHNVDYVFDINLQTRLTGCLTDYIVCCSFMSIQLKIIGKWLLPILFVSIASTVITVILCLYFSSRLGSDHDFERFLALYGTCTGTVSSGISLVKLVDPSLKTGTDMELGIMNIGMSLSTPVVFEILAVGLQKLPLRIACFLMLITMCIYLILLRRLRVWGKPTFVLGERK